MMSVRFWLTDGVADSLDIPEAESVGVPLPVAVTVIIALVVWKPVWVTNAIPLPICDAEVVRDGVVDADWVKRPFRSTSGCLSACAECAMLRHWQSA